MPPEQTESLRFSYETQLFEEIRRRRTVRDYSDRPVDRQVMLDAIAADIGASGARICLVGLGCPRQEVFVSENAARLSMPTLAVGAAFGRQPYYRTLVVVPGSLLIAAIGLAWTWQRLSF